MRPWRTINVDSNWWETEVLFRCQLILFEAMVVGRWDINLCVCIVHIQHVFVSICFSFVSIAFNYIYSYTCKRILEYTLPMFTIAGRAFHGAF